MTPGSERYHASLGSPARRQVLAVLQEASGPLDAAAVAARLGLHVTTARFHLDQLVAAGLAVREVAAERRRGRPRILFAIAGPARDEHSREQLIRVLADALAHRDDASALARRAGAQWADELGAIGAVDPVPVLLGTLERIGFDPDPDPELDPATGGPSIRLRACPFRAAARAHPEVVCGVHRGLIDRMLEPTDTRARLRPFVEPDLCLVALESSSPALSR